MTVAISSASTSESEVAASGRRRRFTVDYKMHIVQEAARCRAAGEIGSLLRREGLFSSQLTMWRKQYAAGVRHALSQKRGPKPQVHAEIGELARMQHENAQLRDQLARAELLISIQKNSRSCWGSPTATGMARAHDGDPHDPR